MNLTGAFRAGLANVSKLHRGWISHFYNGGGVSYEGAQRCVGRCTQRENNGLIAFDQSIIHERDHDIGGWASGRDDQRTGIHHGVITPVGSRPTETEWHTDRAPGGCAQLNADRHQACALWAALRRQSKKYTWGIIIIIDCGRMHRGRPLGSIRWGTHGDNHGFSIILIQRIVRYCDGYIHRHSTCRNCHRACRDRIISACGSCTAKRKRDFHIHPRGNIELSLKYQRANIFIAALAGRTKRGRWLRIIIHNCDGMCIGRALCGIHRSSHFNNNGFVIFINCIISNNDSNSCCVATNANGRRNRCDRVVHAIGCRSANGNGHSDR